MILNNYRQNYQWNFVGISVGNKKSITEGYTDEIKQVILFFYYQRIYRRIKNYRWKIHRLSIYVGDFVGKLITDKICVLRRRKNSADKTVKSCSGCIKLELHILRRTAYG
jgi:hypothetical protein